MNIHAARRYVSPRTRTLTPEENETRNISYAIKDPWRAWDFPQSAAIAAGEMADLIEGPCNLVPIPSSRGSTEANRKLANAIAQRMEGARVVDCLCRTQPVESSCERHRTKRGALPVDQHHLERDPSKWLDTVRTYFVDNTTTSGNTLRAARKAVGFGDAIVFSDASPNR